MDIKTFNDELRDYDLYLEYTPEFDYDEDGGLVKNTKAREYWIENISDSSVGIFPCVLTDTFTSLDELYLYWQEHREQIVSGEDIDEVVPQNAIPHQAPLSSQIYRAY